MGFYNKYPIFRKKVTKIYDKVHRSKTFEHCSFVFDTGFDTFVLKVSIHLLRLLELQLAKTDKLRNLKSLASHEMITHAKRLIAI